MKWSTTDLLQLASEKFKPYQLNVLYKLCKQYSAENKIPPTFQRMKNEKFMSI